MLAPLPTGFRRSRDGLHALAFYVVSPARRARTGRIGLQWIPGGFGTPFFPDGTNGAMQVRVEGTDIVVQTDGGVRSAPISTLRAAGDLVGIVPDPSDKAHFDIADMPPLDEQLGVTADAVTLLDGWFSLGTTVLERLRVDEPQRQPSTAQLWPEHFDLAIELGDHAVGERATFGFSPGDAAHQAPYAYVSAWGDIDLTDPYWSDLAFRGASLAYDDVATADDPATLVAEFFCEGIAALSRHPPC